MPTELRLEPAAHALFDALPRRGAIAFDVVATDADGDGDVDALVNWHHHGPFELLSNRDGRFASSVDLGTEPDVFAESDALEARIRAQRSTGLHLWHDVDRGGRWRFFWYDPDGRHRGVAFALETSLGFLLHEGLADDEIRPAGRTRLEIRLPADVRERAFSVQTLRIGVRLAVRRETADGTPPAPLRVGPSLRAVSGDAEIWKGDPHGVAWLDLVGRGRVDLFVSRGALGGELTAPGAPKRDRWLRAREGAGVHYAEVEGAVLPDHGRARRVEAVDLDADGRLELWIGARDTPSRLLVRQGEGFVDRAAALGLDARDGAIGAFADVDGDGRDDLVLLEAGRLELLRNVADDGVPAARFERVPGASLGLVLPPAEPPRGVIDPAQLRPVDLDRDGDLDLVLLAYGRDPRAHLFLREREGFVDVTADWGVAEAATGAGTVVLDLDLDGLPDLLQPGEAPAIWHNRGTHFERLPLPAASVPRLVSAATTLDADGDGDEDVLLVGRTRRLLWNRSEHANAWLRVDLPASAVGATVTAEYADGSAQVQRFGSAHATAFSQALQPLLFGSPADAPIQAIRVRWPGRRDAPRIAVEGRRQIALRP